MTVFMRYINHLLGISHFNGFGSSTTTSDIISRYN